MARTSVPGDRVQGVRPRRTTTCHGCGNRLIGREWYCVTGWHLTRDDRCAVCGVRLAGVIRGRPTTGSDAAGWQSQPLKLRAERLETEARW
jgi:ribosomal protein L34E